MSTPDIEEHLDACGLLCPEPVMLLHSRIRALPAGAVLEIHATDPSTERDIPKFCEFLGHELLARDTRDDTFIYRIRKKSD